MRIALLVALLVLLTAGDAAASVARLRIDWAPADNSAGMPAPYIYVDAYQAATQYQSPCPDPANCPAGPSSRWVEENHDSAGKARTISFVDDSTTQYVTYEFLVAHPYSGFGPDIDGTATITHADGRTFSVPFHLTASNPVKVSLGTSEGLPAPPPPQCDMEVLKAFPDFYPLLEASVDELASLWRTGQSLRLGAVWVCPTSTIAARVAKLGRRPGVVAKGAQELDFSATYGQISPKLKLTAKGRALRRRGASFRAKVTIIVTDGVGATVTYSRKVRLRSN